MTEYRGAWGAEGVRSFLADAVIPLRLACRTPSDRLWLVSLWFVHRDGDLWCATARTADVVSFVEADDRVAFEVSTNEYPYRGVRGNGRVAVTPDEEKGLLRDLLRRYLGDTDSPLARRLLAADREEVRLRVAPDRIASWDFTDRMPAGRDVQAG